jgi:hypothetical protein
VIDSSRRLERERDIDAFRADAPKIGLAGVEDEPSGLCDSTELLPSLSGAVLRPSAPRERVPSRRARHRSDAELRAGLRRKTPADRLHLGSIFNSRGGRRREACCLAASDVRLHPPVAGGSSLAFVPRLGALPQGYLVSEPRVAGDSEKGVWARIGHRGQTLDSPSRPKSPASPAKPTPGLEPGTPSLRVKCSTS